MAARQRLGALTRWPSQWQIVVNSTVEAIATMNFLFSSFDITLKNKNDWSVRDRFEWSVTVEVSAGLEEEPRLSQIYFSLQRRKHVDGAWGPWVVLRSEIESVLGLCMLHFYQQQDNFHNVSEHGRIVGNELYTRQSVRRVLGAYDELAKMDYDRWILRQPHPVQVENLDDFTRGVNKRCDYVVGNPRIHNLGPGASVLGVITGSSLESICGQSIYTGFMSEISEHIEIGGEVQIWWGNIGVKGSFGLVCPGLDSLAGIVEQAGLANTEEAYMSIVPAFSRLERLPISAENIQVLDDIVKAANNLTRQNRRENSDSFLLWLFNAAKSAASVHMARKQWRNAGKIYSALRAACDKLKDSLAVDYTARANGRISLFCETVCTIMTLDYGSQKDPLETASAWMIELLGDTAQESLDNWKQANLESLPALESSNKDQELRQAAEEGRGLRVGQLLADAANIDGSDFESDQRTPLIFRTHSSHRPSSSPRRQIHSSRLLWSNSFALRGGKRPRLDRSTSGPTWRVGEQCG